VGGRREALTGVGHGDLVDLIGVEPDLALAALEDARGEPLLQLEGNHRRRRRLSASSLLPSLPLWCVATVEALGGARVSRGAARPAFIAR
jgi:hypothetical protein